MNNENNSGSNCFIRLRMPPVESINLFFKLLEMPKKDFGIRATKEKGASVSETLLVFDSERRRNELLYQFKDGDLRQWGIYIVK